MLPTPTSKPGLLEPRPKISPLRLLILAPCPRPDQASSTTSNSASTPSVFPSILYALTGTTPPPDLVAPGATFAGYTAHPPVRLRTKYYAADVGVWCDEVPWPGGSGGKEGSMQGDDDRHPPTLKIWTEQMLSLDAGEVRTAIGGIVLILPYDSAITKAPSTVRMEGLDLSRPPSTGLAEEYLEIVEAVNDVRNEIEDENFGREITTVVLVQVILPGKKGLEIGQKEVDFAADRLEDEWLETRGALGWEFVGWDGVHEEGAETEKETWSGLGEKVGMARVIEALELTDWSVSLSRDDGVEDEDAEAQFLGSDDELDFTEDGIKLQGQELEREMMGLKLAIRSQLDGKVVGEGMEEKEEDNDDEKGEDIQVEQLQGLMQRVVAIREAGEGMGKEEREKFARREVERIMREMG